MDEMYKIRRWVTGCMLSVLVLTVATPFAVIGFWKYRISSELKGMKARGEPTTLEELGTGNVPDAQNAEVIYAGIFKKLSMPSADQDSRALGDFLSYTRRCKNPDLWPKARKIIARYEGISALAEKALSKPNCRFPVDYRKGLAAKFPPFFKLRFLARLLGANAVLSAKDGRTDDALRLVHLSFKVNRAAAHESSLIPYLAQVAAINSASAGVRGVAQYGRLNEAQARELSDLVAGIDLDPAYVRALQTERVLYLHGLEAAMKERYSDSQGERAATVVGAMLLPDRVYYLSTVRKLIVTGSMPFSEVKSKGLYFKEDSKFPLFCIAAKIFLPTMGRALVAHNNAKSRLGVARAALGVTAYRAKFGAYPASLAVVGDKLKWDIPKDSFTGKDLIYRRQGQGFMVYSIGPDLRDNGGLILDKPALTPDDTYDIVWKAEN